MTRNFRFLLTLAAGAGLWASAAQAQTFPNAGFEQWAVRTSSVIGGVEAPVNWLTDDDHASVFNALQSYQPGPEPQAGSLQSVVRTSVAHGGAAAAQLQTAGSAGPGATYANLYLGAAFVPNRDYAALLADIQNGTNTYVPYLPGGAAFASRPTAVQFYYQLFRRGQSRADSSFTALVDVQLTRNVNGKREVVARARQNVTNRARAYRLFSAPLRYLSSATPDSVQITFRLRSNPQGVSTYAGTVWRIDDISFTGAAARSAAAGSAAGQSAAALAAALNVYPNPSADGRYLLSTPADPALLAVPLAVVDAQGVVVHREEAPKATASADLGRPLNLSDLPAGLYTVQLFTADGVVTRRLSR